MRFWPRAAYPAAVVFETLTTGIDGLDAILGGGIRYPKDTAAFLFINGGPGTGKTLLALEMIVRAWLEAEDGTTCLYYSVEQMPLDLARKLASDFDWYGYAQRVRIRELEQEVPHKLCLEAETARGRTRLVLTQANPAALDERAAPGTVIDVDWILAEIGNYRLAGRVKMACIDNIGLLLSDLDYFAKRTTLIATRRRLMGGGIHGIFVQEDCEPRSLKLPTAEEFSTDVLLRLDFAEEGNGFKARSIEILKARHQYYYRGRHHYSIAGRDVQRDIYLGARNERGPGVHIYPSVAAQLSITRDRAGFHVPRRGDVPIDLGHPAFQAPFLSGTGPAARSSSVLLAEPGTRYTFLALRFLAASMPAGERALLVSTKEDRDALQRICGRESSLRDTALTEQGRFHPAFRVLYLHPEFISSGKFTWDIIRMAEGGHSGGERAPVTRLAFDNIYRLGDRFPLIREDRFLVPALVDLLTYRGVTSFFVDLVPPGAAKGRTDFDPAYYMTTFDNVFHLYLEDDEAHTPRLRVLKSTANDFARKPVGVDYRSP
ncbi:MAG: ATPase domain-containing protein [Planctomycetota bacterium]